MIIALVVFVEQSQRRIPVQYAKRMVGRRVYGGTSTYIPMKVNMAGVIPVIFAASLIALPALAAQFAVKPDGTGPAWATWVQTYFVRGDHPLYMVAYTLLILFFTFFYVSITFNPTEVADNMKKYGGFIPGIRAGRPTAEYLQYVLTRITVPGAIYLALISLIRSSRWCSSAPTRTSRSVAPRSSSSSVWGWRRSSRSSPSSSSVITKGSSGDHASDHPRPPGAGKGTQAARIAEHFGIPRSRPATSSAPTSRAETRWGSGEIDPRGRGYVSDDITNAIVESRLAEGRLRAWVPAGRLPADLGPGRCPRRDARQG